jgi:hypothetical protein
MDYSGYLPCKGYRLRISYQGEVSREKREQVELAAELIKKILSSG